MTKQTIHQKLISFEFSQRKVAVKRRMSMWMWVVIAAWGRQIIYSQSCERKTIERRISNTCALRFKSRRHCNWKSWSFRCNSSFLLRKISNITAKSFKTSVLSWSENFKCCRSITLIHARVWRQYNLYFQQIMCGLKRSLSNIKTFCFPSYND